jgi:hypothetical protein
MELQTAAPGLRSSTTAAEGSIRIAFRGEEVDQANLKTPLRLRRSLHPGADSDSISSLVFGQDLPVDPYPNGCASPIFVACSDRIR